MDYDESPVLMKMKTVFKAFASQPVLQGVSLSLNHGEILALIGGNGAGKSTLMKIIAGLYKADSGDIEIEGEEVKFSAPADAHKKGVYLVPQEPMIFPNMTIEENIMIGMPVPPGVVRKRIKDEVKRLDWHLDTERLASTLSIAEQQLVEILRGLVRQADILILDEPTSTLTFGEINSLFKIVNSLTKEGLGVIYITHRFSEIFQLADSVAVLRGGVISLQGPVTDFTYKKLVEALMPIDKRSSGSEENHHSSMANTAMSTNEQPILSVHKLFGERFHDVSFDLFPGEILGVAGVVGAGRTELAEAIFGLAPWTSGTVTLLGDPIAKKSIRTRMNKGLVYVPEDRHSHGVFRIASIKKNMTSTILHRFKSIFLPFKKEKEITQEYMSALEIKSVGENAELSSLSGGNQQKVVLAKYLVTHPKVIILDEPTRGIDAGSREDIYKIITELQSNGLSVMLISSDIEEVVRLSDRVLVMYEGRIERIIKKQDLSIDAITSAAFGVKKEVVT
ncbi:monosaccharide ABC transporter ATP-binding protein (CUT2 family) [Scopulibacillus darangshiensis]|uniref:Autoinducer 2 import ATP-binding protein LsrA n=1 Tax=Scopulibacillus darangshiensis TaxID=442528 RepID=A0A4R2P4A6_9BACL|nr:sugar ABC transporter ATP-binding protein [Scopulibacillus darangshiensis]TCP29572.1 monosaccharide ABC transporter ATP-binding protein (CUT2 family) [Scopulibacillus darangshiensis]